MRLGAWKKTSQQEISTFLPGVPPFPFHHPFYPGAKDADGTLYVAIDIVSEENTGKIRRGLDAPDMLAVLEKAVIVFRHAHIMQFCGTQVSVNEVLGVADVSLERA